MKMRDGIPAVVRHNTSLHHWSGGDTRQYSAVRSTLTVALLLFAACVFLPASRHS